LNYELDTYLDALQHFPENADMLQVARGTATLIKKDIFKNLMWYVLPDSNKQYPLTIERVKKIKALNHQNIIPEEMEAVDVTSMKQKEVEPAFVDLVGHISLQSLEKADKKRNQKQQQSNPRQIRGQQQKGGTQRSNSPQQKFNPSNKPGQGQRKPPPLQQPRRPPLGNTNDPKKDQ
jgi:Na+-transporting NADH:ubiquinone oxidoreductase subunit NqrC